jgi:hypothetical protein
MNMGKIVDELELTFDEMVYYSNYAGIDTCDLCGEYFGIINYHDSGDFVVFNGKQFLCKKCRE